MNRRATYIRPDNDPSRPNGAAIAATVAVLVLAAVACAGYVLALAGVTFR